MTFLEMQTRVGELINQTVTDDNLQITETEVKANLNIGYKKVVNKLSNIGQDYYVRKATFDLVAAQSLYGLPADFRKMIRLELGYDSATNLYKAAHLNLNAMNDPSTDLYSEARPFYMIRGNNIELFPTPTSNITAGGVMLYIENVVELDDDADEPELPFEFDDLPVIYAAAKAKASQGLLDEAQVFLGEFYRELDNMVSDLVSRSLDDNEMVIVRDEY